MCEAGKKEASHGDEELAYIHLVKFSRLYDVLKKREKTLKEEEITNAVFPFDTIMEKVEKLHSSLSERYYWNILVYRINFLRYKQGLFVTRFKAKF